MLFSSIGRLAGGLAGTMIPIPGVGSALGGYLGGRLGGLLDGGGSSAGSSSAEASGNPSDMRSRLAAMLAQYATGPATATPQFQAGRTALNDTLREQTAADEARLARTGGAGGEAEVALAGARGQARASGLTRLVGLAGDRQLAASRVALGDYANQQARNDGRARDRNQLIASALQTVGTVLPSLVNGRKS
ncbi:MAG: hypothetical protein AAFQ43_00255 [Bacteroidota bacterium]